MSTIVQNRQPITRPAVPEAPAPKSDEMGNRCTNRVSGPADGTLEKAKIARPFAHF